MINETLTDKQIEEITEVLAAGSENEQTELLKRILDESDGDAEFEDKSYDGISENTEDKPYPYNIINKTVIESKEYVKVDPRTGAEEKVNVSESNAKPLTDEVFEDVDADNGIDTLASYGLSDTDAVKLFDVITRFRAGEKFNIYSELPFAMKTIVKQMNGSNMGTVNSTAKDLLNHFIRDMYVDKGFVDLQESLQKELKLTNLSEMYNDDLKKNMEVELLATANDLEEKGELDKAELLRKVSSAFTDSYEFTTIAKVLNENEIIQKRISKDLTRYKRFVNEFNYKYKDSKFRINNIKLFETVLPPIMEKDGITKDDIKKFVIVICKATQHMSPENVDEHSFMYYTIQNVLQLQHLDLETSSFGIEVYNNLLKTINLMKEVDKYEYHRRKK